MRNEGVYFFVGCNSETFLNPAYIIAGDIDENPMPDHSSGFQDDIADNLRQNETHKLKALEPTELKIVSGWKIRFPD